MDPRLATRLNEIFPVPGDDTNNSFQELEGGRPKGVLIRSAESGFDANSPNLVSIPTNLEASIPFRELQVEQLLDQAADLLDRGLRFRAEYDELAIRALDLGIELKDFEETDRIHVQETKAGFYDLGRSQSNANLAAEQATQDALVELSRTFSAGSDERNRRESQAQQVADLSSSPVFLEDSLNSNGTSKTPAQYSFSGGQPATRNQHLTDLAAAQATRAFDDQVAALGAQVNSIAQRLQSLQAIADFERRDGGTTGFRFQRKEVERRLINLKALAATEPNGILNFPQRMSVTQSHFQRDFKDAISRMQAAAVGLNTLFGYNAPLPNQETGTFFDDCLIWVRDAIAFLVRFSLLDQNYVQSLSLRNNILPRLDGNGQALETADQAWEAVIVRGETREFNVAEELFGDSLLRPLHVRLRGVSVIAVEQIESDDHGLCRVTLRPPSQSFCRHLVVAVNQPPTNSINQRDVPPCCVGRVESNRSERLPDVCGVQIFHNASPFGRWTVAARPFNATAEPLNDLLVELYVASRHEPL